MSPVDCTGIVKRIWEIVKNDDKLQAFEIIPLEKMPEGEPSPLKYEDHNVGLEIWCAEQLFLTVYHDLLKRTLDIENQKAFLTSALLLNSDVKTFWNMRRELVTQNQLDLSVELRFINLVLSLRPKCSDPILYRRWLLRDKLNEKPLEFLVDELNQIHDIADDHDTNNHLLWDYCTWLHDETEKHPEFATFTYVAWHLSGQYMSTHPSDSSHFYYRQQIVKRIIHNRDQLRDKFSKLAIDTAKEEGFANFSEDDSYLIGMVVHEFGLNAALMDFYPNHEALWCYRRFLIWCWFVDLPNFVSRSGERRVQRLAYSSDNDCPFRMYFLNRMQPKFFREISKRNNKFYSERYRSWVNTFV